MSHKSPVKVNMKQTISYATGNFGLNIFFNAISTYLLYFYTDDFGITAAAAGSLMFISQLVNLISNPVMGVVVDQTRSRWGKFRPYLLFGCFPLALLGVLTFSVPPLGYSGRIVYAYITYILFNIAYSFVNVPYSSILAVMSENYFARARIASIKVSIGQLGGLLVTSATLPLVRLFHIEAIGFQVIYSIFALILIVTLLVAFYGTKGVRNSDINSNNRATGNKHSFRAQFMATVNNKYLIILLLFIFVVQLSLAIKNSVAVYFFKYNVGRPELFSLYSLVGFSIMIIFILVNPSLVNRLGKRNVGIIGQAVIAIGLTGFYIFSSSIPMVFVFGGIAYAGFGLTTPLLWAMVPDTVEYGEWKTGVRAEGHIYAAFILVQLLSQAVSAKLSGSILSAVGYVPNRVQPPTVLSWIVILETIMPTVAALLGILILAFYKYNHESYAHIVEDIQERRDLKKR